MADMTDARPWWPGRTDEVQRVADRCRKRGWPDGELTVGEIAAKTGSDVWIADDALAMNAEMDDLFFALVDCTCSTDPVTKCVDARGCPVHSPHTKPPTRGEPRAS